MHSTTKKLSIEKYKHWFAMKVEIYYFQQWRQHGGRGYHGGLGDMLSSSLQDLSSNSSKIYQKMLEGGGGL